MGENSGKCRMKEEVQVEGGLHNSKPTSWKIIMLIINKHTGMNILSSKYFLSIFVKNNWLHVIGWFLCSLFCPIFVPTFISEPCYFKSYTFKMLWNELLWCLQLDFLSISHIFGILITVPWICRFSSELQTFKKGLFI